jgi:hypothetical protein
MEALKEWGVVKNGKIEIDVPNLMESQKVEIIIIPIDDKISRNEKWDQDLSHWEQPIEDALSSGISDKTHEMIFEELVKKYA